MSALASLKLVAAKRPNQIPPVLQRRNKLVKRIWEQIQLATAAAEGRQYAPMQLHTVVDEETGQKKTVEIPKRVKPLWYVTDTGKLCISLKYGAKVVEFAKGKTAVELAADGSDLIPTLETLKQAVENGELDAQLEAVSGAVRNTLKK
jgi:Family of unknown function (DUF6641)